MAKKKANPNPSVDPELLEQAEEQVVSDTPAESASDTPALIAEDSFSEETSSEIVGEADEEPTADETGNAVPDTSSSEESTSEEVPPMFPDEGAVDTEYDELLQALGEGSTVPVTPAPGPNDSEELSADDLLLLSEDKQDAPSEPLPEAEPEPDARPRSPAYTAQRGRVLTIDAKDEIQTDEEREATIWHEIQNAYRTRRILTGKLDAIEKAESGLIIAAVGYKGFRVAIPLKEMMLHVERNVNGTDYADTKDQLARILNSRVCSEIDFIIMGIENKSRSIVASRKAAMLKKRQTFYLDLDNLGEPMIYEGRVVQARVIAVAEKVIRVEVFGVETSIRAQGLSWEWISDAKQHFSVGDRILVRVLKINRPDVEHITIQADVRSVSAATNHDNLKKCIPQSRYAGRVTDVHNGVVYIRLNIGVNAVAHSCYDRRTPGKNDDVSFAVTRIDEEQGVAVGIITRIIKQNL